MNIRKFVCNNEDVAIKLTIMLTEAGIKCKRLGSAVVHLVTMHNANTITNVSVDVGYSLLEEATQYDIEQLLKDK